MWRCDLLFALIRGYVWRSVLYRMTYLELLMNSWCFALDDSQRTLIYIPMPPSQAIKFAQFIVTSQVFHTTKLCAAMVNLKPILPGHSLVIPKRVVPRYADLSADEVPLAKIAI